MIFKSYLIFIISVGLINVIIVPNIIIPKNYVLLNAGSILLLVMSILFLFYSLEYKVASNNKFLTSKLTFMFNLVIPFFFGISAFCQISLYIYSRYSNVMQKHHLGLGIFLAAVFLMSLTKIQCYTIKYSKENVYLMRRGKYKKVSNYKSIRVDKGHFNSVCFVDSGQEVKHYSIMPSIFRNLRFRYE